MPRNEKPTLKELIETWGNDADEYNYDAPDGDGNWYILCGKDGSWMCPDDYINCYALVAIRRQDGRTFRGVRKVPLTYSVEEAKSVIVRLEFSLKQRLLVERM